MLKDSGKIQLPPKAELKAASPEPNSGGLKAVEVK